MTRPEDDLDAVRRRVLNVVGHALRTPVTTLCGLASELSRADDPATRAALAEGVRRNAATVETLLDDLLLAAGVSTVLPSAAPAPVSVGVALRAVGIEAAGDATALAPPGVIEEIVSRLLDNAHRYSQGPGDPTVAVSGPSPGSPGPVVVTVTSTGGLPSTDELRHAFEPFFRGEHAVMRAPGLGVGLPVARALAQHAGGEVTLEVQAESVVARVELPAP